MSSIDSIPSLTPRSRLAALLTGLFTGAAAGLVGVGGGEFRIPALIRVLNLPLHQAASVNLVIGLCTVAVSLARRAGSLTWTGEIVTLATIMSVASIAGSVSGCLARSRVSVRPLKWIVTIYLLLVGTWMVYESLTRSEHVLLIPRGLEQWVIAVLVAFAVAFVSGMLGVAGGEMRIPALLYLFALPLKDAGTVSLLVSIPTVAAGAFSDRLSGRISNTGLKLAGILGAASVIGVLLGAQWLPDVNAHVLKGIFGAILLVATVRLFAPMG